MSFASDQHLSSLSIGDGCTAAVDSGGKKTLNIASLSISGTGRLDLANGELHGGDLASINALVKSGYNNGNWAGHGIITSSYHSGVQFTGDKAPWTTVGVGLVNGGVVARCLYQGDVDLNGVVNAADFAQIKYASLNQINGQLSGRPLAYSDGDVDYNGVINAADFAMTKSASLNQGAALAITAAPALAQSAPPEVSDGTVAGGIPLLLQAALPANPFCSTVRIAAASPDWLFGAVAEALPDSAGVLS